MIERFAVFGLLGILWMLADSYVKGLNGQAYGSFQLAVTSIVIVGHYFGSLVADCLAYFSALMTAPLPREK